MSIQLYHPYPFPKRWRMAASLIGRSGGHPINIVLLKMDIPDAYDVERKTERRKAENKRKKERISYNPLLLYPLYNHTLTRAA